jgi:hypothetical protein
MECFVPVSFVLIKYTYFLSHLLFVRVLPGINCIETTQLITSYKHILNKILLIAYNCTYLYLY